MKYKTILKFLSLLLIGILLVSIFLSCGDTQTPNTNDTETDEVTSEPFTETTTVELAAYDYLPEQDYKGEEFNIVTPDSGTRYLPGQILTEEDTGDIIMDAAYIRNRNVEEKFNVKIVHTPITSANYYTSLKANVFAGDDTYDLSASFLRQTAALAVEPIYADISSLPYINLSMPWYASANQSLDIGGKQTLFFSDMTCITLSCTYGMFFNSDFAERNGIEDVQKLAAEGKWTIDKLLEYSAGVTVDLNGDGVFGKEDQYGNGMYVTPDRADGDTGTVFQYGMGQFTATLDNDGKPELILNNPRTITVLEKLNSLYYDDNRTYLGTDGSEQTTMFANNQILFFTCIIMHAPNYMRDMTDDYKIIPMPKFDLNQENYHTTISQSSSFIYGIPATAGDLERSSIIFDALSYEGYENVIPSFFEISMKVKYSRDELSSQMFDLLRNSTYVDFGLLYDGGVGMSTLMSKLLALKSTNFASAYAEIESKTLTQYNSIIDAINQ